MKKLIAVSVVLGLTISVRALPTYDNFSTYGTPGTWTETSSGIPTISYPTGAPQLGGQTAPSGESWIVYTNSPVVDLYTNYYSGDSWPGITSQNVSIVNYFANGQPGASDSTSSLTLPAGFPGPFVTGHDTRTNSVWTPGWGQSGILSPGEYLGGVGACLKFSSDVAGTSGNKVFVSFFVDVPDCTGSFGAGQSSLHGYSAGFLPASEIPSPNSSTGQNALPGYTAAGYTSATLFEKFNIRDVNTTSWRPGVYDTDANVTSVTGGPFTDKTIHFIVLAYEFNGGATLDKEYIWIDPPANVFAASTEPLSGLPAGSMTSHSPASGNNLPDVDGFFFLANTQDGGATPNSGVIFNSLSIGTSWTYVTGGPVFTTDEPYAEASAGQTLVLHPTAVAGGGVAPTYSWANSGGPLTLGSHYSVNATTGALTIANIQSSDADTYTLTATGVNSSTASAPTLVIVNTSQTTSGSTFTMNFTGPAGSPYRIWYSSNLALEPVLSTWTLATGSGATGNFSGGGNTYTDTAASSATRYYTITSP